MKKDTRGDLSVAEVFEILIPGLKQFRNGQTSTGLAWFIGTVFGYVFGVLPGFIIHGIYIWTFFKEKVTYPISSSIRESTTAISSGVQEITALRNEINQKNLTSQITILSDKGILNSNERVVFFQSASYRGGIQGYVDDAKEKFDTNGFAFILSHSFTFYNQKFSWKLPYERITEADLGFFQLGGVRGFLAFGENGRQLQQTKNTLELTYFDEQGTQRTAKFEIHGALTIMGSAVKAREFLNHLFEFKDQFSRKDASSQIANNFSDPLVKLEKLKKLKDQGVITELEFEMKKSELLKQL